jgi:uncharacterized protein (TIGR00369 family)
MELPHTAGCMVCGRHNPYGLHMSLHVDESTGIVTAEYFPQPQHIGFEGIIHGGVLSTVLDEAMVWVATWAGKRFCVAGELNVRFRKSGTPGKRLSVIAKIDSLRSRLIETVGELRDEAGELVASGSGKYVPVPVDRNRFVMTTFVDEPGTAISARMLRDAAEKLTLH